MGLIQQGLNWADYHWINEGDLLRILKAAQSADAYIRTDRIQVLDVDFAGDARITIPISHAWLIEEIFITTQSAPAAQHYLNVEVLDRNGEYVWYWRSRNITAVESASVTAFSSNGGDYTFTDGVGQAHFGVTWPFKCMRDQWTILVTTPGMGAGSGWFSIYVTYRDVNLL